MKAAQERKGELPSPSLSLSSPTSSSPAGGQRGTAPRCIANARITSGHRGLQDPPDPTADYDKDLPIIPPPVVNPIEARVPLIVLARSQNIYGNPEDYAKDEQGEYAERESGDYGEYENSYDSTTDSLSQPMKRPLSRITELTERTEGSPLVPSRQHAQRETFGSESMSSLGQIIGVWRLLFCTLPHKLMYGI